MINSFNMMQLPICNLIIDRKYIKALTQPLYNDEEYVEELSQFYFATRLKQFLVILLASLSL